MIRKNNDGTDIMTDNFIIICYDKNVDYFNLVLFIFISKDDHQVRLNCYVVLRNYLMRYK